MSALHMDARPLSADLDLFMDTLPVLPYDSFTQGHNIFFHEGLQADSPLDSGSLEASGSGGAQSSESPTAVIQDDHKSGSSKPRGGKKGGTKGKDQEQLERIRAKNRRAQSRYRAKLKAQAQDTVQSHDQVADELARLRLENAALAHSNDLMDRVLTVREDYMASLKGGAEDAALGDAVPGFGTVTDSRRPPSAPYPGHSPEADAAARQAAATCGVTGLSAAEVAKIKCSDPAAVVAAWQALVPRLEDALTQLRGARDADSRALAWTGIQEALHDARMYCFEHAVYKPHNIQQLLGANLGVGRDGDGPGPDHWAFVAAELELDEAQRAALAPLRDVFLRRISRVMAERRAVLGALAAATPASSLAALQQSTADWLRVNAATSELSANLQQEHMVCMEFVSRGFGGVLTPLQKAIAIVRSYPYFPDIYSISTASLGPGYNPTSMLDAPRDFTELSE